MKSNLDHLPDRQQEELAAITGHLLRGFETATDGGTSAWRRYAKIHKIILFGSYARGDFVDEPENGYLSDFDILVVVSDEKLTDIAEYWYETEQKILHDPAIGRIVNLLVNDLDDINKGLDAGRFFFREVIEQGVVLYEVPGHIFHPLKPLTPQAALDLATLYDKEQRSSIKTSLVRAAQAIAMGQEDDWPQKAAFDLHQATEAAYIAVLLLTGFYAPRSHNILFLRGRAEAKAPALISAWPRETREARKPFGKLKRAYVDARYNQASYQISTAELQDLRASVETLVSLVRAVCDERLTQLAKAAEEES
ncbi:HEPN domain-containing protein [Caulobacter endophyticus]|uniref:HEPN domain-containing protein n=1 Tax=Caulobacter endophyticus TaxID=2172652 RepID=UPI00240EFBB4|nr:HEPN domain-containing protein [Caulobacter endophyticus]MDG2528191.1 HEPN domain-containing protein [Caulobacter endophyticus]